MINIKLAKLKFIVDELLIASFISSRVSDPFTARTIARHVLIRANDFINIANTLRKPLKELGVNTKEFTAIKRTYAAYYKEYYEIARHKIGAHVQDIEIDHLIKTWNEIENIKISYFTDGALEIYKKLSNLSIPGYINYTHPAELISTSLITSLKTYQNTIPDKKGIDIGTDPLASTRNNTSYIFNLSPLHTRAGQINLLRRWITSQFELLSHTHSYKRIERILKARIVTDLVSLCDCLITRSTTYNKTVVTEGLDQILSENNLPIAVIENFFKVSTFDREIERFREVRNIIGAHIEQSDSKPISNLTTSLDNLDIQHAIDFYNRINSLFFTTCKETFPLKIHLVDGIQAFGISSSKASALPYISTSSASENNKSPPLAINNENSYLEQMSRWLHGDEIEMQFARHFFFEAFLYSDAIEIENPSDDNTFHKIRKAHKYILSEISKTNSDERFERIIDLIISCSNGSPYPLVEILMRHWDNATNDRKSRLCYAIGELSSSSHPRLESFLNSALKNNDWEIKFQAAVAKFKEYIKTEGLLRINSRGNKNRDYESITSIILNEIPPQNEILFFLAAASFLSGQKIQSLSTPFNDEYLKIQLKIRNIAEDLLSESDKETLIKLIETHDYIGTSLLIKTKGNTTPAHQYLIKYCCNDTITTAGHDQANRHLAVALMLNNQPHKSYKIAETIAFNNPESLSFQILPIEISIQIPELHLTSLLKIAEIQRVYKIDKETEEVISKIKNEIIKNQWGQ